MRHFGTGLFDRIHGIGIYRGDIFEKILLPLSNQLGPGPVLFYHIATLSAMVCSSGV